ncbi:S9 family peptidase [Pseudoalteromonas luteoviolacea]|uniref:alpha/beta hydrolase family protein n=1 Tax=Pseudoalteromonas luteoviolacea TaxID=43657 RepID=UPI001F41B0F6|nr:S9 family peptidase [Pseudoalteromonas luteoviolacea]MCF6442164.1 S9 family peptidase [Pseudoalteromonas luteoviolacea]
MRNRIFLLVVLLVGWTFNVHAISSQSDTALNIERLWQLERLGSPVVSSDGNFIVAPVTKFDVAKDKGDTQLWLFDAKGKPARALTSAKLRASGPVFSPDSSQLAFISKRAGDKAGQIYILPLTEPGEAKRLTNVPTGVKGIKWVGKHLYFISSVWPQKTWTEMEGLLKEQKDTKVSARQWNALPYSSFDHFINEDRQAHVFRISANGGQVEPITEPMGKQLVRSSQSGLSYDIDSTETYIAFNSNGWENQVDTKTDIFVGKIGSKKAVNITPDNNAPDFSPKFNQNGKTLAYLSRSILGFYADTAVIKLYDVRAKKTKVIKLDKDRSVTNITWADNGRDFYSSIDDAGTRRIYHINGKSGKTRAITKNTNFGAPTLLGSRKLVTTNESFLYPKRLVVVNTRNGKISRIDSLNETVMSEVELGTYESVTYKGADGQDIQMWVHYPPGFDKSKKYPLMMLIHGGPHNAITDGFHYRWNAQTFASWGYVTAWPNFHGSSGFGQDFADAINPDWRTKPLKDVQLATEWFEQKSWIDAERMVAAGASYGGFLSSTLLGDKHSFKAFLIHAAVYNMYSQMSADFAVHSPRFGSYWEQPEIYKTISPHFYAENFDTPTLIVHGQLDYRVPVGQGFELFRTLQTKGVESRMIYFPDENHWIMKPNNSIYWYNEVEKWMTKFAEPGGK